jgi:hypothetical protein
VGQDELLETPAPLKSFYIADINCEFVIRWSQSFQFLSGFCKKRNHESPTREAVRISDLPLNFFAVPSISTI